MWRAVLVHQVRECRAPSRIPQRLSGFEHATTRWCSAFRSCRLHAPALPLRAALPPCVLPCPYLLRASPPPSCVRACAPGGQGGGPLPALKAARAGPACHP
jgi:hypothetical protein